MITACVDFEGGKIQIHRKPECKGYEIKPEDCVVNLSSKDTSELSRFGNGEIGPDNKIIWLKLDFENPYFEHAIVEYVREFLSPDQKIFSRTRSIGWHC
jgi:hypothetical protein